MSVTSPSSPFAHHLRHLSGSRDQLGPRDRAFVRALLDVLAAEYERRRPGKDEWPLAAQEPLRVTLLTHQLAMSESALRDRLSRIYGLRPGELVLSTALAIAADLLVSHPDYPVKQVCRRIGLQDDSYFARLFRRYYGVTPRSFRLRTPVSVSPPVQRIADPSS